MATDYDAPRKTDDDLSEDSIEELKARRVDKSASSVDVDETEQAEGFELPGADLSGEELSVRVMPRQADEFTCYRVLPGASPQPAGEREGRQDGLPGVRGLTDVPAGQRPPLEQTGPIPRGSALTASSLRRGDWTRVCQCRSAPTPATPAPTSTPGWT